MTKNKIFKKWGFKLFWIILGICGLFLFYGIVSFIAGDVCTYIPYIIYGTKYGTRYLTATDLNIGYVVAYIILVLTCAWLYIKGYKILHKIHAKLSSISNRAIQNYRINTRDAILQDKILSKKYHISKK